MPTRRKLLLGAGNLLLGGGLVTRGALNVIGAPTSDMRVIADGRCPGAPGLRLVPGRDDEAYVLTDQNGYVEEVALDGLGVGSEGVNQTAESRFEGIVRVYNENGAAIEELYFEFEAVDDGLTGADPSPADIEEALFIASAGGDIPGDGSTDFLAATDHGQITDDQIAAGEGLNFGVGVDLLPSSPIQDLPDLGKFDVKLRIDAQAEDIPGCGTDDTDPGATPPACPLTVDVANNATDEVVESSDITLNKQDVDGEVRTTDGSDGDIDIKDSIITGSVTADSEIGVLQDSTIGGDVTAADDIGSAIKRSDINGDVKTTNDGDIDVLKSTICGKLEASGAIGNLKDSTIGGTVTANGDIDATKTTVYGDLNPLANSDGDVKLVNDTVIKGDITADGAKGDVSLSQSTVEGTVYADGDVDVKTGSVVEGDVRTDGDVTVNGTVEGGVFASGAVGGNGTIQGNDPR